jgi:hypothetical protein
MAPGGSAAQSARARDVTRVTGCVIAWMPNNQRTTSLAKALGFDVVLLGRRGYRRPWTAPMTYPFLAVRTLAYLATKRPRSIVIVAPPVVAALVAWPVALALGATMAIDIHSGALLDRRWRWTVPALRWVARRSNAAIVTLPSLAARLGAGVEPIIMQAPFAAVAADLPRHSRRSSVGSGKVVAVCGWGQDEPIEELAEAARGEPWELKITGRARRHVDLPPNVSLTGFLPESDFMRILAEADAVVVLTVREETTLSGIWEALMAGRPLVTSGTKSVREALGPRFTYVDPQAGSIRGGVRHTLEEGERAQELSRAVARDVRRATLQQVDDLRQKLMPGQPLR